MLLSLLASFLLAVIVMALVVMSQRPPEGFKAGFGCPMLIKARAIRTGELGDAFAERQIEVSLVRVERNPDGRQRFNR